jgi:hypothetical protein
MLEHQFGPRTAVALPYQDHRVPLQGSVAIEEADDDSNDRSGIAIQVDLDARLVSAVEGNGVRKAASGRVDEK